MNMTTYKDAIFGTTSAEFFDVHPASTEAEATHQNAAFGNDANRYSICHWARGDLHLGGSAFLLIPETTLLRTRPRALTTARSLGLYS